MDISDTDQQVLAKLENPDASKQQQQYDWPLEVQQQILGCLLADKSFLDQCLHLVKPYYFTDKSHQQICNILYTYYEAFKVTPTKIILETELGKRLANNPAFSYYLAELDIVCDYVKEATFHRDYFLQEIVEFAKTQAIRVAFAKVIDILGRRSDNKWTLVEDTIREALSIQPNVDLGINYFEDIEERYARMQKQQAEQDYFTSGFPSIDVALSGGLSRGEVGSFCAMSGGGKSLCMASAAADNISRNRRVLYLSLEMDEDKTACRFDAMFTGMPLQMLLHDKDEVIQRIKDYGETLGNTNLFHVKQFPAGYADIATIRAYLSQLALQKGFTPDLIIVDYVGEMKDDSEVKTYESRQKLVRDLRGLAVEYKVCILTGMQISAAGKEAMKNGYIDDTLLADAKGQVRPLDALWSINQEDAEAACGVGRIYVIKHRNGKGKFFLYFKRDEKTLKTTEISVDMYKRIMSEYTKSTSESVDIPHLNVEKKFQPNKPSESE